MRVRTLTGVGARRGYLYLAVFLSQLGTSVAVPILPELQQAFGVSVAAVSLVTAFWGLARLAFDLPLGLVIDRMPTGRMMLVGTLLLSGGAFVSAFAREFTILLLGRVISGSGAAIISITVVVALLALSTPSTKGRVLGMYQACLQGGAALGPIMAGFASQAFGWPAAFLVAALGALAAFVVAFIGRAASDAPQIEMAPAIAAVPARTPTRSSHLGFYLVLVNYATFVLFILTAGIALNAIPLYGASLGLDAAALGIILGISLGLRFIVTVIGSVLSDRYGRHGVMLLGFVIIVVALVLFPMVQEIWLFTATTWFLAIGRLGNAVPVAMLSDHVSASTLGRWIGINRFVADLAVLVGPIVVGLAIDISGFAAAFYLAAALTASVIVLMLVERQQHHQGASAATA